MDSNGSTASGILGYTACYIHDSTVGPNIYVCDKVNWPIASIKDCSTGPLNLVIKCLIYCGQCCQQGG